MKAGSNLIFEFIEHYTFVAMQDEHPFIQFIKIDELSATPKYIQLVNAILELIGKGVLSYEEMLPSINEVSYMLEISRDTVEKSYKSLKKSGVIGSYPGKGYYVANVGFQQKRHVMMLFNKLSGHKKIVYDAFVGALGADFLVDLYVYNNDLALFKRILQSRKRDYDNYVVIPHFLESGAEKAAALLHEIPREKLLVLDKLLPQLDGEYAAVYEDFSKDIYSALEEAIPYLAKYHTLKLVFPDRSYYPKEIIKGFYRFCQQYAFEHWLVDDIVDEHIQQGEVYINLMEDDLVSLLDKIISLDLSIGEDVGVISYNETPVKKFMLNGITTISTDFEKLGQLAAEMLLSREIKKTAVPFYFKRRASL